MVLSARSSAKLKVWAGPARPGIAVPHLEPLPERGAAGGAESGSALALQRRERVEVKLQADAEDRATGK